MRLVLRGKPLIGDFSIHPSLETSETELMYELIHIKTDSTREVYAITMAEYHELYNQCMSNIFSGQPHDSFYTKIEKYINSQHTTDFIDESFKNKMLAIKERIEKHDKGE